MNTLASQMNVPSSSLLRVAGVLYVAIIALGIVSEGLLRGPAMAQADLTSSTMALQWSFFADLGMALCDVGLAVLLFVWLRQVHVAWALGATLFRLVQASILGMNLLSQHLATRMLHDDALLQVFSSDQLHVVARQLLQAQSLGYDLGLVFFGVSCVCVGRLLWTSMAPTLGALMMGAGVVYLVGSSLRFAAPEVAAAVQAMYLLPVVAEGAFAMWLLRGGGNPQDGAESWRGSQRLHQANAL